MIDMDELARLHIYERKGDTWAWVAPGLERLQVAVAEAAKDDQEIPQEGVQADPTPVQAPQVPQLPLGPRTMPLRIQRLEEDIRGTVGHLSQLLDASEMTYMSYGDFQIPYHRRTRRRTEGAITSATPRTDDQLDS
ncbi:hypothetical protein Tco_0368160 [Tanacetum coccineum]